MYLVYLNHMKEKEKYLVSPNINDKSLITELKGIDENGKKVKSKVINEQSLTIFLNNQEIVTLMSIGDHPKYLAIGYLLNQNMLKKSDKISRVEIDKELNVVVVRTKRKTNYENKLKKKITTSGCAIGTIFGDIFDEIQKIKLKSKKKIKHKWIYEISKKITLTPSLYLEAGAIHGCAIIQNNKPLIYMEDVGRHNAADTLSGIMWLNDLIGKNIIFYTTGRLTSEIIMKVKRMEIPIIISRSGVTNMGIELAKDLNVTMIARSKQRSFLIYNNESNIVFD